MPTGFFDLPRELRDQVYYELWEMRPTIRLKDATEFGITKHKFFARHTVASGEDLSHFGAWGLPSWLLACKQVFAEATQEFKSNGIWNICLHPDYDPWPIQSILNPYGARVFDVKLFMDFDFIYREWFPMGTTFFTDFVHQHITRASHVREMKVFIPFYVGLQETFPVDFSEMAAPLKKARLEKLSFILTVESDGTGPIMKESFTNGVKELGRDTMGPGAVMTVEHVRRYGFRFTFVRP